MSARYRAADIDPQPLGDGRVLIYCRNNRQTATLSSEQAALLQSCKAYRTLDEHATNFARGQALKPLEDLSRTTSIGFLRKGIEKLQKAAQQQENAVSPDRAVLERAKSFLADFAAKGFLSDIDSFPRRKDPAVGLSTIGLTTHRRLDALKRGLPGYVANARLYGREIEFAIIDDSKDEIAESENRAWLAAFSKAESVPIHYAGTAERLDFARRLSEASGVAYPTIHFAIFGSESASISTGAARNSLLLDQAGKTYVLVDDDAECRLAPAPGQSDGLRFTSRRDPSEFWFYRSRAEALDQIQFEQQDFLGLHQSLLGRAIGACLPEGALDLDSARPDFDRRLRSADSRVRLTMGGIAGDSGVHATAYLFSQAATLKRLTKSEADYEAYVKSRQVLRAVTRATISEGTYCMAGNLGIDARDLLPPFVPAQRNSDGLFARTLRRCFPDAYLGFVPWAVLHDPLSTREQSLDDVWAAARQLRFAEVVAHLLIAAPDPLESESTEERLQNTAQFIRTASRDLDDVLRQQAFRQVGKYLAESSRPEALAGMPEFFAANRRKYNATLREALASPQYLVPRDLPPDPDLTRLLLNQFADVLAGWTRIFAAARATGLTVRL